MEASHRPAQVFATVLARVWKAGIVVVDDVRFMLQRKSGPDRAPFPAANEAQALQLQARLTRAMAEPSEGSAWTCYRPRRCMSPRI